MIKVNVKKQIKIKTFVKVKGKTIIEEDNKIKILVNSEWFSLNETLDEFKSELKKIVF